MIRADQPVTSLKHPFFELADFGVVGDLFQVVPQLMDGRRR